VTIIDISSGRSLYQRRLERYAREKKHFQRLIYKLKRLALKRGYTKNRIAAELGVSITCIYQWRLSRLSRCGTPPKLRNPFSRQRRNVSVSCVVTASL
jgi:hypothetical protein